MRSLAPKSSINTHLRQVQAFGRANELGAKHSSPINNDDAQSYGATEGCQYRPATFFGRGPYLRPALPWANPILPPASRGLGWHPYGGTLQCSRPRGRSSASHQGLSPGILLTQQCFPQNRPETTLYHMARSSEGVVVSSQTVAECCQQTAYRHRRGGRGKTELIRVCFRRPAIPCTRVRWTAGPRGRDAPEETPFS